MMKHKKKLVIVGAGFAGLQLIRNLDRKLFDILLLDELNHHQFQPLFYQVATSQIEPSSISFPLRHLFRNQKGLQIRMTKAESVDPVQQVVHTEIGTFPYDELVLCMGCQTNFFGNTGIQEHAFTLKSTYDAIEIRNHIIRTFEAALSAQERERIPLLHLVIVGAGPTGVELAGAFAEIKQDILPRDYPGIDFSAFRITLIEGSKDTLNAMSEHAKKHSRRYLQQMGVELLTSTFVKAYDGHTLLLSDGSQLQSKTVIWAAGVRANTLQGIPMESLTPGNRIIVNRYNKVQGLEHVYALGDMAWMQTPVYPKGHPQVANVAINQAKLLARNLRNKENGQSLQEFEYRDLGSMATIGRNKAVVDLPGFSFKGYFAWLVWMFLHLMLILSVRNKLIIFINWAWAYVTKDSSLRLILQGRKNR